MPKPPKLPQGMTKRGKKYYSNFRHDGKPIRRVLSSNLQVAKTMLRELRMKVYRESNGDIDNDRAINELSEAWFRSISQQLKNTTVTRYKQNLDNVLRLLPIKFVRLLSLEIIEEFREKRLREFVSSKKTKTVSAATVNKDVGTLNRMLNWAVERKKIGSNPIASLKKLPESKKEERALELREAKLIFKYSTGHWRRIWYAYFVTGLRKMELANLLFTDIDWEAREIVVRATLTKNSTDRRIPIDEILYEILLYQRKEASKRKPGKWANQKTTEQIKERFSKKRVFVTTTNTPLGNNIYRSFIAICKKCDISTQTTDAKGNVIEVVVLHSLRHSFATDLIRNGADPKTVQSLMGHKTLDMTMRIYAKVNSNSKQQAIGKLSFGRALPEEKGGDKNKK